MHIYAFGDKYWHLLKEYVCIFSLSDWETNICCIVQNKINVFAVFGSVHLRSENSPVVWVLDSWLKGHEFKS